MENGLSCLNCALKSDCFTRLTADELSKADKSKVEINFKKKEIIAKQGAFATHVMYIKSGLVKLYIEAEPGHKDVIINFFSAGEVIGLASLFGKSTFDFSISAIEDSTLCLIDINIVSSLTRSNPDFASLLIHKLNENTIYAYRQLYDITNRQMNGRIAGTLLHLAKNVYKKRKFELTLSRKDLAEFSGMSTMSVIRVMNDLKNDGIVSDKDGVIEIVNMEALEYMRHTG